tara:strand:+ start:1514 stop:1651 length:138 start_codon:yes stop_codon:yes gene_type:complete
MINPIVLNENQHHIAEASGLLTLLQTFGVDGMRMFRLTWCFEGLF